MAKILGLDLGTNSIGWAIVEKNKINNNEFKTTLKDKGVVIFSEGVKKKGNESSRAAERTSFRSARKIKFRRKLRKYETLKVLINNGMSPLTIDELEKWRLFKNPETTKNESFKNYPTNFDFLDWLKTDEENNKNPYFFRDKFSRQKYDWENDKTLKEELGRAFYHIAQRRGFLSNRLEQSDNSIIEEKKDEIEEIINSTTNKDELQNKLDAFLENFDKNEETEKALFKLNKSFYGIIKNSEDTIDKLRIKLLKKLDEPENLGKVKKAISDLSKEIKNVKCETLGQYFWNLYKSDRNKPKNKIRTNYTAREEHYLHEFEIICKTQKITGINKNEKSPDKKYYGLVKELYDAIFYQRPLKSQKGLVGNCSFEKNKPRCPVSHPLFEEYRMWCFINNIKIKTPDDEKLRILTKDEKKQIIPKFYRKSKSHFDFEDLVKTIIPKGEKAEYYKSQESKNAKYQINYKLNTTVSGCPTSANLKSIFGDDWKNVSFNYETINNKGEIKSRNVNYHDLWHILTTFTSADKLKNFALEKLKLNDNLANKFSKISFKKEYASLSIAVIKKILPYLKQGLIYSHAVFMANAEKVVDKKIWDDEQRRTELQNSIKKIIDNNTSDNQITQVINGLIKNCKNPDNNFTYNEQSKESYKKDVEHALQSFYGKNSWKELENNDKILENSCEIFFKQLKKKGGTGNFIKIKRTDEKIIDLLLGKNKTGEIYCSDETRIKNLYHPSDIERFKPVIIKDKDEKEFIGLGSPATPSVRNPMAMRSLFQLRKLINTLILEDKIDQDTKINIELARNLNDANKRKAIERYQTERKELHNIYADKIKKLYPAEQGKEIEPSDIDILKFQMALEQRKDCKIVSKEDVLKYKYWEEQNHICLYTGNTIGLTDFLNKNPKYDIEHTIPRSVSVDNSQENKTLCDIDFNRKIKGNKIPYELGKDKLNEILPRIKHWKEEYEKLDKEIAKAIRATKTSTTKKQKDKQIQKRHYLALHRNYWKGKYERFTMKDVPQGFKNSQKVDIGIISKYAREYLSSVFKNKNGRSNVYSVKGEMTAEFRKAWGLQESYYNEFGKKDYKPKDRSNHIHHCIDAITIACMDKNKYDVLAHAWSLEEKGDYNNAKKKLENSKPWKTFKKDVSKVVDEVFIVHHTPDNVKKQSKKKLRKRDRIVYKAIYEKDINGNYLKNKKGSRIIKEWIYKKDINGNKIPLIRKIDNIKPDFRLIKFINKNNTEYLVLKPEESPIISMGKIIFDKYCRYTINNKTKQIIYEREPIYLQGDTVRGSLHQETFYGAIANDKNGVVKNDKEGNIKPQYVIRKTLLQTSLNPLKESDVENIVDKEVRTRIQDAIKIKGSFKETMNSSIWMNEEKQIPIKKVRVYSFLKNPLPDFKKHNKPFLSKKEYKQQFNVANDENYCMAVYEGKDKKGKIKRTFELVNMIDAGKYYRLSDRIHKKETPIIPIIKNNLSLKYVLTKGAMVIFYNENSNEVWKLTNYELSNKLYKLVKFDNQGRLTFRPHNEAKPASKLKEVYKIDLNNKQEQVRLQVSKLNMIVENVDFKISPTGKITKIDK